MDTARRKRRDLIQNLLIALLSVSAVVLFTQAQLYNLDISGGYLDRLTGGAGGTGSSALSESTDLSAPVRVAVSGAYGRYGNVTLTTSDDAFNNPLSSLGQLLGEALGSATTFTSASRETFLEALSLPSVYYDFLSPLPLTVLGQLLGEEPSAGQLTARRLVIFTDDSQQVSLCMWDGEDSYTLCSTAVSAEDLNNVVNSYELGTASLALDFAQSDPLFAGVDPCSLLPNQLPQLPVLTAAESISSTDSLLTALGFNPNTKFRYTETDGTQVIKEGSRSLRISPNGTVFYQSGGSTTVALRPNEESPSLQDAAARTGSLLHGLTTLYSESVTLYLESIAQNGETTLLSFGYQYAGVPIRFSDGGCAAEVQLNGSTVVSLTLRLRQYAVSEDLSPLLPLRQALAIAGISDGGELSIGYVDRGGTSVNASWLLE